MCITKQKQGQVQGQKSNSTFNIRYSSFNIQNTRNTPKVPSRGQFFLRNFRAIFSLAFDYAQGEIESMNF